MRQIFLALLLCGLTSCQTPPTPVPAIKTPVIPTVDENKPVLRVVAPPAPSLAMVPETAVVRPVGTNHTPAIHYVGTANKFYPVRTNATRYTGSTSTNANGPWQVYTNVILDAPTPAHMSNAFYFFYPDDGQRRFFRTDASGL